MYRRDFVLTISTLALSFCVCMAGGVNVLTYHNNNMRTGANLEETILTPSNVNSRTFGKLFNYDLDGHVYAQPLYMSGLNIAGQGTHNVVFVATEHNSVYALDADSNTGPSGGVLWQVNLGPSAATPNPDFGTRYAAYAIRPEVGITGTPVIDAASGTLFVDAFTHEGGTYYHKLHALDVSSGAERPYSPVIVSASIPGTGAGSTNGVLNFEARQHLQRAALTLANGIVYVAYGGYGDTDPFHGWVLGYSAGNLQPLTNYIFNSTPNSTVRDFGPNAGEGGIWMGGCGLAVDGSGNLYLATGNGSFNAVNGSNGTEYGSSLLKLSSSGRLAVLDYFTPYDQKFLNDNDLDLGSGGIVLLPDQAGPFPHLLVGAGKPGMAYVINRERMTAGNNHYNSTGTVDYVVQKLTLSGGVLATPAYFEGTIYYAAFREVLTAFSLTNGLLPSDASSLGPRTFNYPGATPSISANGNRDGMVWVVARTTSAVLVAYDATNITEEIYDSSKAGARDRLGLGVKFAVPTVANGKVYVGGQNVVSVFGLLPQTSTNPIPAGSYNGLFFKRGGVEMLSSGSFALTTTKRGAYIGRLQMGSSRYSLKGQFDSAGSAMNSIPRKGASALSLTLQVDGSDNNRITGIVSDGDWTADLIANRATFNARTNPAELAGRYTVVFPGSTNGDSQTPQGNGFATITVSRSGLVACTAALADGTKASQSSYLSQDGQYPLYIGLYRGRGQVLGWLNFTNSSQAGLGGQTSWIKGADSGGTYYPAGFDFQASAAGSLYQAPARGRPILNFSDAYVSFTGGNLSDSITNNVTVNANNKVINLSQNKVVLTLTPSSGMFRGTVVNPGGGKPIPFSGVVLQKQNEGSGYFLLWNQSGRVDFGAQ